MTSQKKLGDVKHNGTSIPTPEQSLETFTISQAYFPSISQGSLLHGQGRGQHRSQPTEEDKDLVSFSKKIGKISLDFTFDSKIFQDIPRYFRYFTRYISPVFTEEPHRRATEATQIIQAHVVTAFGHAQLGELHAPVQGTGAAQQGSGLGG